MAVPVGPLAILCIRRSLQGHIEGLGTALGVSLVDGFYALIAALGVGAMGSFVLAKKEYLFIAGGSLLLFLGIRALSNPPVFDHEKLNRSGFVTVLLQTMLLTLTNAMTLVTFIAALAAVGFEGDQTRSQAFLISAGVFVGSLLWFMALSIGVGFLRTRVTPRMLSLLNIASGSMLIAFGSVFIFSGARDIITKFYQL